MTLKINYTEENWTNFLGKLGPHPASKRELWIKMNEVKSQKKSKLILRLHHDGMIYKSDEEKDNQNPQNRLIHWGKTASTIFFLKSNTVLKCISA